MSDRKARPSSDVDTSQALGYSDILEIVGTTDDPCFAKYHDPTDSVCAGCGDSELCRIAQAQVNIQVRKKLGKTQRFMDEEIDSIKPEMDINQVEAFIIGKLGKKTPELRMSSVLRSVWDEFDPNELLTREEVRATLKNVIKKPKARLKLIKIKGRTHIKRK
jgi:hypothetical protein